MAVGLFENNTEMCVVVVINWVFTMGLYLSSLLRNINTDLELLISYHENSQIFSIKLIRSGIFFKFFRKNISSANNEMLCSIPIIISDNPVCALTAMARGSITNKNSNLERGHRVSNEIYSRLF